MKFQKESLIFHFRARLAARNIEHGKKEARLRFPPSYYLGASIFALTVPAVSRGLIETDAAIEEFLEAACGNCTRRDVRQDRLLYRGLRRGRFAHYITLYLPATFECTKRVFDRRIFVKKVIYIFSRGETKLDPPPPPSTALRVKRGERDEMQ